MTLFPFLHVPPVVVLVPLTLLCLAYPTPSEMGGTETKDTFFTHNATVHAAVSGEAYIGYANAEDFGGRKHPASPAVHFVAGSHVETSISAFNKSQVTIAGGKVAVKASAFDHSTLTLSSGEVGGGVYADASSTVNVRGSSIGDGLYAEGNSTVNLSGGSVANGLFVSAHGTVHFSGGKVKLLLSVSDSGTLHLIGRGLRKTPTRSPAGSDGSFTTYALAGKLRDGTSVAGTTVLVQSKTGAKLTLTNVP